MANNQGRDGNQGGNAGTKAGDAGHKGGQGSGGGMPDNQKDQQRAGHKPEDKMNKDWERSRDTGSQGGQAGAGQAEKGKPADSGRMGGKHPQGGTEEKGKQR